MNISGIVWQRKASVYHDVTTVVLCTSQIATSDLIRHNFGHEVKSIVIIEDEDGHAFELSLDSGYSSS